MVLFPAQKSVQKKSHLGDFLCLGLKSSVHFEQAEDGSGNERGDPAFESAPDKLGLGWCLYFKEIIVSFGSELCFNEDNLIA